MTDKTVNQNVFTISAETRGQRSRNILWGLSLSFLFALATTYGHYRYPQTYNDVLLWSIIGFVIIANLFNYILHRRYLKRSSDHRVEIWPGKIQFWTRDEKSELNLDDIAVTNLFRRKGVLRLIQLKLKNKRGIRLEGYRDMDRLASLLTEQVPKAHVVERKI